MKTFLIKVYYGFSKGRDLFIDFLDNVGKTLDYHSMIIGLNYQKGEFFYSYTSSDVTYSIFESQFYGSFKDFQMIDDKNGVWKYDMSKAVIGKIKLENKGFFPFKMDDDIDTNFIYSIFRTFDNFDVIIDKVGIFLEITPLKTESITFYLKSVISFFFFRIGLLLTFFKFMFNFKIEKNWKTEGYKHFKSKLNEELFNTKIYIIAQSSNKAVAEGKIRAIFNNFLVFKNYPQNQFKLSIDNKEKSLLKYKTLNAPVKKYVLSAKEIASFFHFPRNPKNETSLLKINSRKLALPTGIPTFNYTKLENGEVIPKGVTDDVNITGITDYRSITVPVGLYDEDRLKHVYVIGKTGVGKSKFLINLIINDIVQGRGCGIIDPHGDLIEEAMTHIPPERMDDVVIFDPTDEKFPFCLNPLDVGKDDSKQILARGFIDIFKKFFGANWNAKLEHVLRMIFLALLDKEGSTLFDIIRALTDKDFRYDMIEEIDDDVVRNFWTNEFAGWSQQFNTEAIMPILNKVGQLLSIDILKNIFGSPENKIDFRKVMDEQKILFISLPKGRLQEEIMGFLGAMFITKIFQSSMSRQSLSKSERKPFFLFVDEFHNFATETFNEILSEARKYGLGLSVAHQFIKQIPDEISDALFGNVGTQISFRISSDDANYVQQIFSPYLDAYDLANLNQRAFFIKTLIKGQVKDPFSLKAPYIPDVEVDRELIAKLYDLSRAKHNRTLEEAMEVVKEKQKDVIDKIEEFVEPII